MLELYHWEPNIFYLKPLIALAEKQLPYSARWFDATGFEQFAPGFPRNTESHLQLEREGPVLVHDGAIISSSFFQLEYIAEAFPGPALLPADPYDRYRAQAWGQVSALIIASAVTTLGCARYLAPQLKARPAAELAARIAAIEPPERRASWSAVLEGTDEPRLEAARNRLAGPVRRLEAALERSPWIAGATYSIADIDAFAMLFAAPALAPALLSESASPRVMDFLQRMHGRPAVQAALARSRSGKPAEAFIPGPEAPRWG